jgi:hypothetical protein
VHNSDAAALVAAGDADAPVTPEVAAAVALLWRNEHCFEELWDSMHALLGCPDNAAYFIEHHARAMAPDYEPSAADALRAYAPTRGVSAADITLRARGVPRRVEFFDIGSTGARGAGAKPRHRRVAELFSGARGVVWTVSLAEYEAQVARADGSLENVLERRVADFAAFLRGPEFRDAAVFLLLTQRDVFADRLHASPLRAAGEPHEPGVAPRFRDYRGTTPFAALAHVEALFAAAAAGVAATTSPGARRKSPPPRIFG